MYDDTTTEEAFVAIQDYFNHLEKVGYMRYDNVFRLIVFLYIDEILHAYTLMDITEEDYNIINNTLQCLYGTCLLPYPEFIKNLPYLNLDSEADKLRQVEWDVLRQTEDNRLRIIETGTVLAG